MPEPEPVGEVMIAGVGMQNRQIAAWLREIAADTRRVNRARAARVMRYPDLVAALREEADVRDPGEWNGVIPPEWVNVGGRERLHSPDGFPSKKQRHSSAAVWNDSPVRVALRAIADEANRRDREAGLEVDDPTSAEIVARHPFPFPGMQRGARYLDGTRPRVAQLTLGEPVPPERPDYQHEPARRSDPDDDSESRDSQSASRSTRR